MQNQKEQSITKSLMYFTKEYKRLYILSIILSVLGVMMGMIPYFIIAKIVVSLTEGVGDFDYYLGLGMAMSGAYILKFIFITYSTSISHTATFKVLRDIRKQLISKLFRMPMGKLLDTPSGHLKDIIVDQVEKMEVTLAHLLPEMSANLLIPILTFIYLFVIDWKMALISLITLPIGMYFMTRMLKTYPAQYEGSVKINKKMNNSIVEYVNGIEVIKAFNQTTASYDKYSSDVEENASYFYNWMKSCQWCMSAYKCICPAVLLTVLPIGILFYINEGIDMSSFITIIILSMGVINPLINASNFVDSLSAVSTIIGIIVELLNSEELIRPSESSIVSENEIVLRDVSFKYHEDSETVIKNINLNINVGEVTALVGPSGSGKSTISKLIAGFWDVVDGEITIGKENIKDISQSNLIDKIAYVSQDTYLFDDTIRENIRMGKIDATDEEVEKVAKASGCDEFINTLDRKYDTVVGSGGSHISGGERQRIAIARAMLKDAPIVILDEATAYIDPENEAIVQKAISKLVENKTLIMIAHRLSTIAGADKIVVMEKGEITATGTHEQLLKTSTLYNNMWQAHIGTKEAEAIC